MSKNQCGSLENYTGEKLLGDIDTSKYLLINVLYHKPCREANWKDFCSVVLKDVTTGEKHLVTIQEPKMLMYIVKEQYRDYNFTPVYQLLDHCDVQRVRYAKVVDEIVNVIGKPGEEFKNLCLQQDKRGALKNLHKYPFVLGTDIPYPDYFRSSWNLFYHNPNIDKTVTKTFLDIEVDSIDVPGFPPPGSCPINAVSYIDPTSMTSYLFALRNDKNPQIEELESHLDDYYKYLHDMFDESYPGMEYVVKFYDENKEIILIKELFDLINEQKRDFLLIWNMGFDIPFIIERIKVLGYDPRDIMCSPDFVEKELYYRKDTFHHDFKTRNDSFTISSYTVFLDQMSQYIKIRKQKGELKSVKLNAIAKAELNDSKLDYSEEANIKTLPYVNYRMFLTYNLKDSLLLYKIEEKTHDIDNVFDRALSNGTSYKSLFSQTILLKNRAYISYFQQGYIIGNNRNVDYSKERGEGEEPEDKFAGAIVGDPNLNDNVGIKMFGRKSKWIFPMTVDFDFSSMYPFAYIAHNCGQESMIGKIVLDGFDHLNWDPTDKIYDGGKMFIEAYLTHDYTFIGNIYFNLPTSEDIIAGIENKVGDK